MKVFFTLSEVEGWGRFILRRTPYGAAKAGVEIT
jgi:hypothetical protein